MDHVLSRAAAVVLIEDEQGLGTGFFVGGDGLVLTNRHVAPSAGPFRVVLADGRNLRGVGLHQSPHHDLAVVSVATETTAFLDLDRDATDTYGVGTEVWVLGHPRGCRNSVSRGIVSNPHQPIEREVFVQTDAGINPGNSGGPLVDGEGRLVGVVSAMLSHSQGIGFAVPSYVAADYVRNVRRMLRRGVLRPAHELHAVESTNGTMDERVQGGVDLFVVRGLGVVREDVKREGEVSLRTDAGTLRVEFTDAALTVSCAIGGLGPTEASHAALLRQVLEANGGGGLRSACLGVRDGSLQVIARRSIEQLDASQVFFLLDQVRAGALVWGPRWTTLGVEATRPETPVVESQPLPPQWDQPLVLPDLPFGSR